MPVNSKSLVFLSDDPPLKSKGSGISVLLYNITVALKAKYAQTVITFCRQSSASVSEIINDNNGLDILICDKGIVSLYRFVKFGVFKKALQFLSFVFKLPVLCTKYNNADNVFITAVGASIAPVYKAWLLMLFAGKAKHCLYIVDDLKAINSKYNNKFELFLIKLFLKRTIRKADKLICISEGLRQIYLKEYQKDSCILLPHYKQVDKIVPKQSADEKVFTFLYTGGLNILYNTSLKFFAQMIEHLNTATADTKFKLMIQTYSPREDFDKLAFNNNFVIYSTTDDRSQLLKVYRNCDAFLIPYSFNTADAGLVSTSFPQKTAEIIQYGKPLLLFGPNYGSVMKFFRLNGLNYVCNEYNEEALKAVIIQMHNERASFSAQPYLSVYQSNLSAGAVLNVFNAILSSIYES